MRHPVALLAVALTLAGHLGAAKLDAQVPPPPPDFYSLLSPQQVGKRLRISVERTMVEGELLEVGTEGLLVHTEGIERWIASGTADSLWIRRHPQRTSGWIGAGLGIGLTTAVCLQTFAGCGLEVGLGVLTPLFALIGAGIGSTVDPWKRLHP